MKKIFTLLAMMLAVVGASAQTYTVAGNAAILNGTASWDPTNTENDMVAVEDGVWQLVVENCQLEADNYEYKVVEDHAWTVSYPADNAVLTITETALYTVTFTLEDTGLGIDVSAEAVKTGDWAPSGAVTLTVAGSSKALLGSEWDPADTNNDMTLVGDDIYELKKLGVELGKGPIQYKVAKDHSWGSAWPSNNASFAVPEDGVFDVTFTFNYATKAPSVEIVKTGSAVIEHTWTVAGGVAETESGETTLFGPFWDATCADNDMTEQADGTWTLVKENVNLDAVTYAFKAAYDHAWEVSYGDPETTDGNAQLVIEKAGAYNVTFTLDLTEGAEKVSAVAQNLGGDSTGIDELNNEKPATVYYNLQGIRTNNLQRGIYIARSAEGRLQSKNGKVMIVK